MDDVLDFCKFFGALTLGVATAIAVFGGIIGGVVYLTSANECSRYHELSGREAYFSWSTACLVRNDDGKWITLEAFKGNAADVTVRNK